MMKHSTRSLLLGVSFAVGLLPFADLQAADVFLETTRPEFQKIPIWIMGFGDGNSKTRIGEQVVDVLKADLERTQVFEVLGEPPDVPAFAQAHCRGKTPRAKAKESGVTVSTWGRIGKENGKLVMEACAYDGGENDVAFGKKYIGGPINMRLLRKMVHGWADELVSHYTGDPGIARTKIVYVSENETGGRDLCVMDYDGFAHKCVTRDEEKPILTPTWWPDRRSVLYTIYRGNNQEIVQLDLASRAKHTWVPPESLNFAPAFSPDGRVFAYASSANRGNSDIFTINLRTKKKKRLTVHGSGDLSPTWSPDGRELAFTSDRAGRPQIYIMRKDGSRVRRLTFEGDHNAAPAWSPHGNWIAYVCRIRNAGLKLCRISPDGEERFQITTGPSSEIDDSPSWAPDGRHLVFSSTRGGQSHIYMINIDGTGLEQLTKGGRHHSSPAWSPL